MLLGPLLFFLQKKEKKEKKKKRRSSIIIFNIYIYIYIYLYRDAWVHYFDLASDWQLSQKRKRKSDWPLHLEYVLILVTFY